AQLGKWIRHNSPGKWAAKGLLYPLSHADSRPRQESNLRLAKYPLPSPPAKVCYCSSPGNERCGTGIAAAADFSVTRSRSNRDLAPPAKFFYTNISRLVAARSKRLSSCSKAKSSP